MISVEVRDDRGTRSERSRSKVLDVGTHPECRVRLYDRTHRVSELHGILEQGPIRWSWSHRGTNPALHCGERVGAGQSIPLAVGSLLTFDGELTLRVTDLEVPERLVKTVPTALPFARLRLVREWQGQGYRYRLEASPLAGNTRCSGWHRDTGRKSVNSLVPLFHLFAHHGKDLSLHELYRQSDDDDRTLNDRLRKVPGLLKTRLDTLLSEVDIPPVPEPVRREHWCFRLDLSALAANVDTGTR